MPVPPNRALINALLEFGRAETPADLAARGVRRVRSVSLKSVSRVIEQAINLTVMERTLGVGTLETELVLNAARERFQRLLSAGRALGLSRTDLGQERADLERELTSLREHAPEQDDVADRRREREVERAKREKRVSATLRAAIGAFTEMLPENARAAFRALEPDLAQACAAIVREECDRALLAEVAASDRRADLLERRIAKLIDSLRRAEDALTKVHALAHVDDGIASIYRTVQGLSVDERNAKQKRELLADIFEANVELRARVATDGEAVAELPAAPTDGQAGSRDPG